MLIIPLFVICCNFSFLKSNGWTKTNNQGLDLRQIVQLILGFLWNLHNLTYYRLQMTDINKNLDSAHGK